MNYLERYDNVVMQKCKTMFTSRDLQLRNIAAGRVSASLDGGYVAKHDGETNFLKTKYKLSDNKFKQVVQLVGSIDELEYDDNELELLYAELAELLEETDLEKVEEVIQQVQNDAQTQTDNVVAQMPDWLHQAAQEVLGPEVLEVLPFSPSPSSSSVNLASPVSTPSPELFSRESPRVSRETRINTRVSPPNQPRTPTPVVREPTTEGSSSNEPTAREARAIARAAAKSKAVKPSGKAKAKLPKAMDINTGSTSRNITQREAAEYMSYLDTLNPNVNK